MGNLKRNIDVVLGSQYGDEAKGFVSKLWADRMEKEGDPFEWTSRVGAQNAEHRFIHTGNSQGASIFCGRILPSASCYRDNIIALLGAGHCFQPEQLPKEAVHFGLPLHRIFVDRNAMWLKESHAVANLEIGNMRGTTGWGVGAATAEKVRRKPGTKLMGDCEILYNTLPAGNVTNIAKKIAELTGPGLMEGSQGCMLSLNHGHYPYCTAKDVTVPGMMSETGVGHQRIRNVIGVARLVMMRVPGPSGPTDGKELSYDDVEQRTGLRLPHHTRLQGDTSRWRASNRSDQAEEERLFDFSMEELAFSHQLNNYSALAVTFADFHRGGNYRVSKWHDLHVDTRERVKDIERELGIPVILVRTGPGEYDNIWRD